MSLTTFDQLGLPAAMVAALAAQRITEPFAIQALTLPDSVAGQDILGRAPTGSGKTLAFGLPALARLADTDKAIKRRPRGLILSPTRELADQIQRELAPLATSVHRRVAAVYGGASIGPQIKALGKGVDLLVACPGRLLDLIDQGQVSLDQVEIAIVDEADRMADMGFLPDVRRILDMTMDDRQTLLFSATLDGDVKTLTDRYQHDPAQHEIGDPEPDLSTMEHRFLKVRKPDRMDHAADVVTEHGSTVVFVRTRHGVDRLARQLKNRGVKAGYIHGGRSQSQRSRALALFTDGKVDALVATDVAARGIHVDGVACVLHYDPPADTKDYVHRSGRTARAGAGGVVISFLEPSQVKAANKMKRDLSIDTELITPDQPVARVTTPAPDVEAESMNQGRGRPKQKSGRPGNNGKSYKGKSNGKPGYKGKSGNNGKPHRKATADSSARSDGSARSDSSTKSNSSARSDNRTRSNSSTRSDGSTRSDNRTRSDNDARPSNRSKPARPSTSGGTGDSNRSNGSGKPRRSGGSGKGQGSSSANGTSSKGRPTKRSGKPRPANRKGTKARSRRASS